MKNIKYVQLEANAFISDMDFQLMSAEQRGVYCTIILYLYCNDGCCKFETQALGQLCNCEDFEKVWAKISGKFSLRNGFIRHRRVTKELRRASKRLQAAHRAGVKGAERRWAGHSNPNSGGVTNENKRNAIEEEGTAKGRIRKEPPRSLGRIQTIGAVLSDAGPPKADSTSPLHPCASSSSARPSGAGPRLCGSGAARLLSFNDALTGIIRPRNQSDRTSFRNIGNWLMVKIQAGEFNEHIFERVLEYAAEAVNGKSRNPAAVFTSILKRQLGYRKTEGI